MKLLGATESLQFLFKVVQGSVVQYLSLLDNVGHIDFQRVIPFSKVKTVGVGSDSRHVREDFQLFHLLSQQKNTKSSSNIVIDCILQRIDELDVGSTVKDDIDVLNESREVVLAQLKPIN